MILWHSLWTKKGSDFQQVGQTTIHVLHSSFLFTVVTHQYTSEKLNSAFPSLSNNTDFLTQSFPDMIQPVSCTLTGPSLCRTVHWISSSNSRFYIVCLFFSFLLLHKLMDWMIIPQWLTHLGVQHLDMFPFNACSQEPSYIVSSELHLPPSNLCEIIQKLPSPRGGTSIITLPPNLGFNFALVVWLWVI